MVCFRKRKRKEVLVVSGINIGVQLVFNDLLRAFVLLVA
jgi:hypothetical protein